MAGSVLALLAEHRSLAYEQIAAMLAERPDVVRRELERLRDAGLVDVLAVGHLKGNVTNATSYWRLTAAGLEHLERVVSDQPSPRSGSTDVAGILARDVPAP